MEEIFTYRNIDRRNCIGHLHCGKRENSHDPGKEIMGILPAQEICDEVTLLIDLQPDALPFRHTCQIICHRTCDLHRDNIANFGIPFDKDHAIDLRCITV